jgi:hypothetical protein
MTIQEAAATALQVQDACNLSGVLRTWGTDVRDAVNAACTLGTDQRNHHPVHVLFANKLADLTGQSCGDVESYGVAYDACVRLAAGEVA